MNKTTIIGIDAATKSTKTGLSRGTLSGTRIELNEVVVRPTVVGDIVSKWIEESSQPVLLAIDSPLGWPSTLGPALIGHIAGAPVDAEATVLFDRNTDHSIKQRIKKTPLSVGADRIGRTCFATLDLLDKIRRKTGDVELVWESEFKSQVGVIEVYPVATLRVHGQDDSSYKKKTSEHRSRRRELVNWLGNSVIIETDVDVLVDNHDALDSALCVFTGAEFLMGRAVCPDSITDDMRTEGWIWACDGECHT